MAERDKTQDRQGAKQAGPQRRERARREDTRLDAGRAMGMERDEPQMGMGGSQLAGAQTGGSRTGGTPIDQSDRRQEREATEEGEVRGGA